MAFFEIPKLKSNQGINFVFISKLLFVLSYVVEFVKQLLFILTYTYMPLFAKTYSGQTSYKVCDRYKAN